MILCLYSCLTRHAKRIIYTLHYFTICTRNLDMAKRNREQLNISERKVYRRILCPVHDNEKENWTVLTNKEI